MKMKKFLPYIFAFCIAFSPHAFAHEITVNTSNTVSVPISNELSSYINEYWNNKYKFENDTVYRKNLTKKIWNELFSKLTDEQYHLLVSEAQKQINEKEQVFVASISKTKDLKFDMDEVVVTTANVQTIKSILPNFDSFVIDNGNLFFGINMTVDIDDDKLVNELTQKNAKLSAEKEIYKDKADYAELSYNELDRKQVNPVSVNDTDAGNLIKLANQSYTLDNFNQAIQYAQQASLSCNDYTSEWEQAQIILAKSYMMKGDFDTAIGYTTSVIENNFQNYNARVLRMQINMYKAIDMAYINTSNLVLTTNYGARMYCVQDVNQYMNTIFPIAQNICSDYLWFRNLDYQEFKSISQDTKGDIYYYGSCGYSMLLKFKMQQEVMKKWDDKNYTDFTLSHSSNGLKYLIDLLVPYTDTTDDGYCWDEHLVFYNTKDGMSNDALNRYNCSRVILAYHSAHDAISYGCKDDLLFKFIEFYFVDYPMYHNIDLNGSKQDKRMILLSSANQHSNRYFNKKIIVMLNNLLEKGI